MPRRATPELPPERRQALVAELRLLARIEKDVAARAALDKYVHVSRAYDAGMTVRDIAAVYDVSPDTAKRWKDLGERERRRTGADEPEAPDAVH